MATDKTDDEIELDFSGIKNLFGKKKKESGEKHHETHAKHESHEHKESAHEEKKHEHHEADHKKEHEHHKAEQHESHKKHETEHKKEHKEHHAKAKEDSDEINIDFGSIGRFFKGSGTKSEKESHHKSDEDLGFDASSAIAFFKKHAWIPAVLIMLLVVWMSVDVRMQTASLGFTDNFASQSVANFYRNQIGQQIAQQNPNLPPATRNDLIEKQYQQFYAQNTQQIQTQVRGTSLYFKTAWEDEAAGDCQQDFDWMRCKPYMPDIDPYYWYRYARNIEAHGYPGDEMRDGLNWDNHMLAPIGRPVLSPDLFHPYTLVHLHSILKIFSPNMSLYQAVFFYPVVAMALSTALVFLIARRIAGNIGGLFAGAMFAYSFAVLNRTLFGHGDTDAWVTFFPILATWLYLEAFETSKTWLKVTFAGLSAIAIGFFGIAWGGWWYIFDFILAMSGLHLLYQVAIRLPDIKKSGPLSILKAERIKTGLIVLFSFIAIAGVSITLLNGWDAFIKVPIQSLGFTRLKDAVLPTLWPNVLTTVAELNEGSIGSVINAIGGTWLFWIGLMGIGFSMLIVRDGKKKMMSRDDLSFVGLTILWYGGMMLMRTSIESINIGPISGAFLFIGCIFVPVIYRAITAARKRINVDIAVAILLAIWFAGTTYASFKGIRFTLMLAPAYAVAFGVFFGVLFTLLNEWLKETIEDKPWLRIGTLTVIFGLFFYIWFWPPGMLYSGGGTIARSAYSIGNSDVPIVNDAWWNALSKIRTQSKPNAQINSWWDFGHHFKAIADRPVTFDGTTQDTPQAHWTGLALLTSDERETMGILRQLACGANSAFDTINAVKNDTVASVKILDKLHIADKDDAVQILRDNGFTSSQTTDILKLTHCDPPEMFFITSDDMIGKAGVWAHFGSWNFERAYIYTFLRTKPMDEAVSYMIKHYNYSRKEAEDRYFEVQAIASQSEANAWVSPWPGYVGSGSCSPTQTGLSCPVTIQQGLTTTLEIDTSTYEARMILPGNQVVIPQSITYVSKNGVVTKKLQNASPSFPYGFVLIPGASQTNYVMASPELASSVFTQTFYLKGHGLKYLQPFSHDTSISGTDIYTWKVDWSEAGNVTRINDFFPVIVDFDYIGYYENGTVFDSSINGWQEKNVTKDTDIIGRNDSSSLRATLGRKQIIDGLDRAMASMPVGKTQFVEVPPELGYGTDPNTHPLGNKTITFKIVLRSRE